MKKTRSADTLTDMQREALRLDETVRGLVTDTPLLHAFVYPNQRRSPEIIQARDDKVASTHIQNAQALLASTVNRLVFVGGIKPGIVQRKISGSAVEILTGQCYSGDNQLSYVSAEVPKRGQSLFTKGTRPWVRNILFGEVDRELSVVRTRFITLYGQGEGFNVEHTMHTTSLAEALEAQDAVDILAGEYTGDREHAEHTVSDYKARTGEAMRFASTTGLNAICEIDIAEIRQRIEQTFGAQSN